MFAHDHYYEFGVFRLVPATRQLLRAGESLPLTAKVFDLLLMLVEHSGALLERDSLMNALWPNAVVEESNLTQSIFVLRKTLGERRDGERFVLTVPGRGYRFVAAVKEFRHNGGTAVQVVASPFQTTAPLITSIAILPLKTISASKAIGYLGTGIADAIITVLSRASGLIVRPTTAILKYGEVGQDPMQAGRELKVEVVLDGTIQQIGDRIRVSVQLIKVSNGTTLWAGRFTDALTDLFALQDSIAEQVARELKLEIGYSTASRNELVADSSSRSRSSYSTAPVPNLDVWQLYLKGRYFQDKRTEYGLRKSIAYAEEEIALAPDFAMGYSCLADSYNLLGEYLHLHPDEAFPQAKAAVQQALALDPALAEAHASHAEILMFYERDWAQAEREYKAAIALNPNYAAAYHWYAWLLMTQRRFDEASHHLRLAQRIDPGSLYIKTALGLPYYYQQQYDQAIAHHRQALELDANFSAAHYYLGEALAQQGNYDEAIHEFQQVQTTHSQQSSALLAHTLALANRSAEARAILAELQQRACEHYVSPYCLALIHVALGEVEETYRALEQAVAERAAWLIFLQIDPFFARLRGEERFETMLREGLAAAR
jgi:TolB-like protein/Tfp pilus assembly protein PilF